jgi:hypothetical protein
VLAPATIAVPYLQLSYKAHDQSWVQLPRAGDPPLPLQCAGFVVPEAIIQDTTFYIAGYATAPNNGQSPLVEEHLPVTLTYAPPRIRSFKANPQSWPFAFGPTDVTLEWDIEYARQLKYLTVSGFQNLSVTPKNQITAARVTAAKTWTLKATGQNEDSSSATAAIDNERPLRSHKFSVRWNPNPTGHQIFEPSVEGLVAKIKYVDVSVIFLFDGEAKFVINKVKIEFCWDSKTYPTIRSEDSVEGIEVTGHDYGISEVKQEADRPIRIQRERGAAE